MLYWAAVRWADLCQMSPSTFLFCIPWALREGRQGRIPVFWQSEDKAQRRFLGGPLENGKSSWGSCKAEHSKEKRKQRGSHQPTHLLGRAWRSSGTVWGRPLLWGGEMTTEGEIKRFICWHWAQMMTLPADPSEIREGSLCGWEARIYSH